MAVAIRTTNWPPEIPAGPQMYDAVTGAIGLEGDPPEGLIFHWAGEVDGQWTITDVWESREDFDRFREQRLFPAIEQVSGMDPAAEGGPQPEVSEFAVHSYFAR
jgi:hypothetical protein